MGKSVDFSRIRSALKGKQLVGFQRTAEKNLKAAGSKSGFTKPGPLAKSGASKAGFTKP